jgi:hypothetical protein
MPTRIVPLLTILLCAFPISTILAADAAIKKLVKENVQTLNDSLAKGDFAKVVDLTHPKIVELLGGRENSIATMEKGMKEMNAQGIEVKSVKVGDPSDVVKQGDELYLYVPFELTMKLPNGKVTIPSYVIGLSTDQGKSWTYVDANGGENIKKILPNLPSTLKLPEKKKPVMEKD